MPPAAGAPAAAATDCECCSPTPAPPAGGYDCSLPGLGVFAPGGTYQGLTVNYLSSVTDTSSPQFRDRALEFEACTGARIVFSEAANVFEDPIADVGTKTATGLELYDGYLMSYSHFPEASSLGLAETLNDRIAASAERLRWVDFFPQVQKMGMYRRDGRDDIDFLMFDGDFFVPLVRIDILEREGLPLPNTWEEAVSQAQRFHGTDLNGDGENDFGFCHFPRTGAGTWDWWIAELVYSTWATMAQDGVKSGFHFDVETFEPLLDNPAFREAAAIWKELWNIGEGDCGSLMTEGRCFLGYAPPGCWKGVFLNGVSRRDNGTVVWQPTMTDGSYAAPYRQLPFGSLQVLDDEGQLQTCTEDICPRAVQVQSHGHVDTTENDRASVLVPSPYAGELINRAPFYWSGGFGTMIRKSADPVVKDAIWDFFVYINSPETSVIDVATRASWIDSWRMSQLTAEGKNFVEDSTWPRDAYDEHRSAMQKSLDGSANGALNLRIPGIKEYSCDVMGAALQEYWAGTKSVDELVVQVTEGWKLISEDRGIIDQLQTYRATLGLEQISEYDLCQRFRSTMDSTDPRTCRQYDPPETEDNTLETVMYAVGAVIGVGLVLSMAAWVARTFIQKRRLQRQEEERQFQMIEDAVSAMRDLRFPMVVLQMGAFMDMGSFVPHEEIRSNQGSMLAWMDTPDDIDDFAMDNFIIFLSHQWLSWTTPDPDNLQYECARAAIADCALQKEWDREKVHVWLDVCSIPQKNKSQQLSAISSLPIYASSAHAFIVIAPEAVHKDLCQVCSLETYQNRAWCRAELLSHSLANGVDDMFLANSHNKIEPVRLGSAMMNEAIYVFEGELSCCRKSHEGLPCCDRERLMVPFLGLYGLQHVLKTKGTMEEQMQMGDFLNAIDKQESRVFPSDIGVVLKDKGTGKTKTEKRVLFKGLLDKMKRRADQMHVDDLQKFGFNTIVQHEASDDGSYKPQMVVTRSRVSVSRRSSVQSGSNGTGSGVMDAAESV